MKRIIKYLLLTLAVYLVYMVCTALLPYVRQKAVPESFASSVSASSFYGDGICIDRVALVEEPQESLGARIKLLDEAQHTIDLSYYAMHMGPSTDLFLGSILYAAERGVQVRILVDGMSGGLTSANRDYAAALGAHPNISLRLYNPPNFLKPWTINGRLHDKYIIIDNKLLLLGGRNIGDKYFNPEGFDRDLSIDRDVLVYNTQWQSQDRGSVLFDVRSYMYSIWDGEDVVQPFAQDTDAGAAKREELLALIETARSSYPDFFQKPADYEAGTFPAHKITFLHNDTEIGPKAPKVGYALGQLLLGAEQSICLQSPYVVLDDSLESLLQELGHKQIDYQILTNSLASSPNLPAYSAYLGDRKAILKTGARLWEYQSSNAIHAKTYLVDDRISAVGSYNLDPRSAYIDTELMLVIDSEAFTLHLKEVQAQYLKQSLEVGSDGEYRAGQSIAAQPVSTIKRIAIQALSFPIRLVKCLV